MEKMQWSRLVSDKRFGFETVHDPKKSAMRSDFRRDYDRLVFSSPFRRLQNKTQVFPLPGSIFVHNRLTHSLEVSCVGRSIAERVGAALKVKYADDASGTDHFDHLGDIAAAACLAHDLGNPPFGHSGEKAIGRFFSEGPGQSLRGALSPQEWDDLTHFEGNANAFRMLTHQFRGRRRSFGMTYSTLASIVKYPFESSLAKGEKFGFFTSEREAYERVAHELGLLKLSGEGAPLRYARHPLVYIVEAADDICYEVMDIEDAHKLKILSTDVVTQALLGFFDDEERQLLEESIGEMDDPNEKVAHLRSAVVGRLTDRCARAFLDNEEDILAGRFEGSLLDRIPALERAGFARCNDISWAHIYRASDVVDVELAGNRIITFLLEAFVEAVMNPQLYYSQLLLSKVPEQFDVTAPTLYGKIQGVLDHLSAMTDVYALDLYRKLKGLSLPGV